MINVNTKIGNHVEKIKFWNPITEIPKEEFDYIDLSSVNKDTKQVDEKLVLKIFGEDAPSRARQVINTNDILVSTVRPNLNGVAIIKQNFEKGTASTGYCVLRTKSTLYPNYLFYWVQTKIFIRDMVNKASGASYPAISDKIIKESKIPLPPLDTQKKIAAILDAADAYRQKTKTLIDKYDQLAQALFLDMFGDPGVNPKGWKKTNIGESCYFVKDGPHVSPKYVVKGVPFISVNNIIKGYWDLDNVRNISEEDHQIYKKKCNPEKGDILYTKGGTTGFAKYIDIDLEFSNWVHLAVLKFDKSKMNGKFFEAMLNSRYCYDQSQIATRGIANRDLVLGQMKKISHLLPPITLQNQFAERIQLIEAQKQQARASLQKAENLFNSLLQQAFKGEIG